MVSKILDATAFYAGLPFRSQDTFYVTNLVYNEIQHIKKNHNAIQLLIDTKRLLIQDPNHTYVEKVKECAKKTGDLNNLSIEDISSISLSLELGEELVTDDFAASNVAKNLASTKTEMINIPMGSLGGPFIFLQDIIKIKIRPKK